MLLRVDPTAATPIVEQLCRGVKDAVASGRLAGGDQLPSVRELARELVINPNTVARAYERLEADGVIVRRQGAGCFVRARRAALPARERGRRLEALMRRAVTDAFHLGATPAEIAAALQAALERLHFPDDGSRP